MTVIFWLKLPYSYGGTIFPPKIFLSDVVYLNFGHPRKFRSSKFK